MGIDYNKMTSVELARTIENYIVKCYDKEGRRVLVHVERRVDEGEIFGEEFEVVFSSVGGVDEDSLSPEEQNEVIEFVKHFLANKK